MFYYFITALVECHIDSDCPKNMCLSPRIPWCVNHRCECVAIYSPTNTIDQRDCVDAQEERLISSTRTKVNKYCLW
jgi:hypothetical protein